MASLTVGVQPVASATSVPHAAPIRALIASVQRLFAEALGAALDEQGFTVVGIAMTPLDVVSTAKRTNPDLVIVDLEPTGEGALGGWQQILQAVPGVKVVAVTANDGSSMDRQVARAGFHGVIHKDVGLTQLTRSLRAVARGAAFEPGDQLARTQPQPIDRLTPRERDVLLLLVDGASTTNIAQRLGVSENTVRSHVQNLMSKMQVHSRLAAVSVATRSGLAAES
ncbi:MAG TPA: response regulator transcription factor [Actinomycetota bacterium]